MCFMTILSTTSNDDLSLANSKLVQFIKNPIHVPEEKYLRFKNKWFLASNAGCSCNFRHLSGNSIELGFGEPEAWFPEESESVEASIQIAGNVRALLQQGANVDCVDAWAHGQENAAPLLGDIQVNIAEVSNTAFRFFENYRFSFIHRP